MLDLILLLAAFLLPVLWLYMVLQGAPYRISRSEAIKNMLALAGDIREKHVAELGSGDGRIVIALAQAGAHVHGYEINPFLVWYSRWKIHQLKIKNATIHWQNFWSTDLRDFDYVIVFQLPYFMARLSDKIKESPIKIKIISNMFDMPGFILTRKKGTILLYDIETT